MEAVDRTPLRCVSLAVLPNLDYRSLRGSLGKDDVMSTYPTKVSELPSAVFYAILFPETVNIPSGKYPEHTLNLWKMEVFPSREKWAEEVEKLSQDRGSARREFKAVRIAPATVAITINVSVEQFATSVGL